MALVTVILLLFSLLRRERERERERHTHTHTHKHNTHTHTHAHAHTEQMTTGHTLDGANTRGLNRLTEGEHPLLSDTKQLVGNL